MKHVIATILTGALLILGPTVLRAEEGAVDTHQSELPLGPIFMGSYGLVTLAVGAGFGLQAYQENERFNEKIDGIYPNASKTLADDIKMHGVVADVLMFSGAAVAIGGLLWWVLDDDYHRGRHKTENGDKTALRWRPLLGPTHASVVAEF